MSKQSSVEWFYQRILAKDINEVFEQAKAMHKEEIEEAHYDGSIIRLLKPDDDMLKQSEQYYNETFGGDNE